MNKFGVREYALGVQHLLAMFGSTVLVPLITGLSPAVALFTAGVGTLLFHLCTKGIVPVFQGSSFAYIGALCVIIGEYGIPAAQSGIVAAGLVYLVLSAIVYAIGPDRLRKILPPIVTGPVIIIIGLSLTGVGVKDAFGFGAECVFDLKALQNIFIALFVFTVVMFGMNSRKKLFNMVPILLGILFGYLLCVVLKLCGLFEMDFTPVREAPWLNLPFVGDKFGIAQIGNPFTVPQFNLTAILLGLFGKFGAVLQTIPAPVKGGIELILFGMIASVGVRTIVEAQLNMASTRNLCIMGSVLCAGIGLGAIGGISLVVGSVPVNVSALFVATVVGVLMNAILPQDFDEKIKRN